MKWFKKNKKSWIVFFVFLAILIPVIFRLVRPGFFSMYDDMQVIRVQQMDKCIKDGQFPCRWVPDLGYGYGYPLFIYYAPLPYYIMEGVHLLGFSYINTVKIGFIFSVFLSGLFFYLLSRNFFSRLGSLATTALYIYVPFRAADLYVRGAMGELWGMVSLPLVILGFEYFIKKKDNRSLVFLSFSVFIFLISHNLTILISAPFIIIWVVIRLYDADLKFHEFKKLAYSTLLGVGLSSFFIIPLIAERNLVYIETLTKGYFNFVNHFLSIKQLLFSTHWGYGPSIVGPYDDQSLGLGPLHFVVAVLSLLAVGFNKSKKAKRFLIVLFLTSFGYLFLAHSRSTPLWNAFSFLSIVQFPWRFVFVAVFITSFLFGYVVDVLKNTQKLAVFIFLFAVLVSLYGPMFKPKDWFLITDAEKLSGDNLDRQLTASIYDYLPKSAKYAPKKKSSGRSPFQNLFTVASTSSPNFPEKNTKKEAKIAITISWSGSQAH